MKLNSENFDVIIIGGGASGLMAGAVASSLGKKVLILERNKNLGEKLKITGGGRCNITNADYDVHSFLKNYGKAEGFLYTPFSIFGVKDTFKYFEDRGLELVVEARNRAFPKTQKAIDVFNVFKKELEQNNVFIKTSCTVLKLIEENKRIVAVDTNQGVFNGDSIILSTGGLSHPETGATGDGFKWLKALGHTVKDPTPTIVPLAVKEDWVKVISGNSLSFMKISFFLNGKKAFSKTGKVLFTHFGLSGPLILNSSSKVAELLEAGTVTAKIDAYPDTNLGALDKQIVKIFDANKNKLFKNVLKEIVPVGTFPGMQILFSQINEDTPVHSITKEERKYIVDTLKALPITVSHLMGYDRSVVADGGVSLEEIDFKTMNSKKISNLYVTGDLLNINRPSGGFSLQLCWTTGFIAGKNV
jgi:predicted Rossmann fold flavoprotein